MPIKIGSILIDDNDHNDFFDPKIDEIKSSTGAVLSASSPEVSQALAELGLKSLKGVHLKDAGELFSFLDEARFYVSSGDPEGAVSYLSSAEKKATDMGLPFDVALKQKLTKQSYENGVKRLLSFERIKAQDGDVVSVEDLAKRIKTYAAVLETDFKIKSKPTMDEAEKILVSSYGPGAEACLKKAENYAKEGYEPDLWFATYPPRPAPPPPAFMSSLGNFGRSHPLLGPGAYGLMSPSAKDDPVPQVLAELEKARLYSTLAGKPFDEGRAAHVKAQAFSKGIDLALEDAEGHLDDEKRIREDLAKVKFYEPASDGFDPRRVSLLNRYLQLEDELYPPDSSLLNDLRKDVDRLQSNVRRDLSPAWVRFADQVLDQGSEVLFGGIKEKIKDAKALFASYIISQTELRRAIAAGDVDGTNRIFNDGEKIAMHLEEDDGISIASVDLMKSLDEAAERHLELDFKYAEALAAAANLPATEDCLKQARRTSEKYSLKFDETRAAGILTEARKNHIENLLHNAEWESHYGFKTTCLDLLKKAEAEAKTYKLPFDAPKAAKIRLQANTRPAGARAPFSFRIQGRWRFPSIP